MNARLLAVLSMVGMLGACDCTAPIVPLVDGGTGGGTAAIGGGSGGGQSTGGGTGGETADGGCFEAPAMGLLLPPWGDGGCPTDGCPAGQVCVHGVGEGGNVYGCSVMPAQCSGTPSCECMGCICGFGCIGANPDAGSLACNNGTISRRSFKDDVHYIDDRERADFARQALAIRLARYRYKAEPTQAKPHLGFIIDDQPASCPAVHGDQTTVDEYGYTSMLLATVQQQQAEIAELKRRIEQLERHGAKR